MTTMLWARDAQYSIAEALNPLILDFYNKKNMRSLSAEETEVAERTKFAVLSKLTPFCEISPESLGSIFAEQPKLNKVYRKLSTKLTQGWIAERGKSPTVEDARSIQAIIYALMNSDSIPL